MAVGDGEGEGEAVFGDEAFEAEPYAVEGAGEEAGSLAACEDVGDDAVRYAGAGEALDDGLDLGDLDGAFAEVDGVADFLGVGEAAEVFSVEVGEFCGETGEDAFAVEGVVIHGFFWRHGFSLMGRPLPGRSFLIRGAGRILGV
jgi:hypothetical protein